MRLSCNKPLSGTEDGAQASRAEGEMGRMQAFTLRSVTFGYPGRDVFAGLSLLVPRGKLTALVGGNGAGKSTLLSLIAGTDSPRSGLIQAHVPGRAALVVQRSAAAGNFPITVRGTVEMGRWGSTGLVGRMGPADRRAVERAMDRMGILGLAGRPLGELSGGQRQRALVAQGLAQEANVLLLDEPGAGLDGRALDLIDEVLREEVDRGVTVLQATHDLERAAEADHCILLAGGRALAGKPRLVLPHRHGRFELPVSVP